MRIKKPRPFPVVLGALVVFLVMLSLGVRDQVLRLQISDVAIFLAVLFFYDLLKEDLDVLERRVEKIEEMV